VWGCAHGLIFSLGCKNHIRNISMVSVVIGCITMVSNVEAKWESVMVSAAVGVTSMASKGDTEVRPWQVESVDGLTACIQ
jgi:hypothetical protein